MAKDFIWMFPEFSPEFLFSGEKHRLPSPELHSGHSDSTMYCHVSNKDDTFNSLQLNQNQNSSVSSNSSLTNRKIQLARFQYLKQQQMMKNQSMTKGFIPPGMRKVFINNRKESSGTGVFLPRQTGEHKETKKHQGLDLEGNQRFSGGKIRPPWAAGAADRLPPEWTY